MEEKEREHAVEKIEREKERWRSWRKRRENVMSRK